MSRAVTLPIARASMLYRAGLSVFAAIVLFTCCISMSSAAEQRPATEPPAILTINGKIKNTNRGPLDPTSDLLFAYHNLNVTHARHFSREALLRLPQHEARAKVLKLEDATYSGPLLSDVLKEAGATGTTMRVVGLDGYAADFNVAEMAKKDWILALSRSGKSLGIGDLGPLWLVRAQADGETPEVADKEHWVWAAFYIDIQ